MELPYPCVFTGIWPVALSASAQAEGSDLLARTLAACPSSTLRIATQVEEEAYAALAKAFAYQGVNIERLILEKDVAFLHGMPSLEHAPIVLAPWGLQALAMPLCLAPEQESEKDFFAVILASGLPIVLLEEPVDKHIGIGVEKITPQPFDFRALSFLNCPHADAFVEKAAFLAWYPVKKLTFMEDQRRALGLPSILPRVSFSVRVEEAPALWHTLGLDVEGQVDTYYGMHRSGWAFATQILRTVHNPYAPYFESILEKRFNWGDWAGGNNFQGSPITKPWLGIIHVPLEFPVWFHKGNSFLSIRETPRWKESAPFCKGLFTLSAWHKAQLETLPEFNPANPQAIPIFPLFHPAEVVESIWNPEAYQTAFSKGESMLIQVGTSYRNLHALQNIPSGPYKKVILRGAHPESFMTLHAQEEAYMQEQGIPFAPLTDIEFMDFVAPAPYDALFAQNVVLCEYYTLSASNTIVECMVRGTPLLINPLPPAVEYLGAEYPLYFTSYEEAASKAADPALVLAAHAYLMEKDMAFLSQENFLFSILRSPLYTWEQEIEPVEKG